MGIVVALLVVVLALALPILWTRFVGRRRPEGGRILWRGYVSFYESSLSNRELFPNIHARRAFGGIGRKG